MQVMIVLLNPSSYKAMLHLNLNELLVHASKANSAKYSHKNQNYIFAWTEHLIHTYAE